MKTIHLGEDQNQEAAAAITVDFLMNGGVVVMPTDTSYGLAADATNAKAVEQVVALKGREPNKPFSVIVAGKAQAESLGRFSPVAHQLWDAFMPGSLTLIVPVAEGVRLPETVTAGGKTVGLRHPDSEFALLVAERFERPYTATSANRASQPPAFTADEFLDSLPEDQAPHLVIDAGQLPIGPVSTVVEVTDKVKILREGAIPAAKINDITGATS